MRDKIKENFPELAEVDFKRIRLYKSGSRGSILKKVAKNVPDATQLLHKFKGGTSKRVYLILKNDDENGERSNSGNDIGSASATQGRTNAVVPRDAGKYKHVAKKSASTCIPKALKIIQKRPISETRQYLTALSQSASTQQMDNGNIHVISARDMSMHISTDANLLQSPFGEVIDVDLYQDVDLSRSLHTEVIDLDQSHVWQGYPSSATETSAHPVIPKVFLAHPFYSEGTKVGTVKEDLSPQGLGDSSNLPSRTNEVIRLEKRLLAACKGDDTFLPCFLVDSFHEARQMNKAMGVILLNPKKEDMAIREGIVRHIHDTLSEVLEKTCDALKVLSSQREQLDKFRAEREEQDDNFRRAQLDKAQQEESEPRKAERQVNTTCIISLAATTLQDNEKRQGKPACPMSRRMG
ncbi:unnamed protein product [Porites lobata]|uniref:Uncharacterized protein n=1 Tax=Porites lobata TaxID=104759 RepID=A0ABN8PN75_9CNID|nr:unnamed protein product [Porites lobata]